MKTTETSPRQWQKVTVWCQTKIEAQNGVIIIYATHSGTMSK
jgi:hypothetical protein